MTFEQFFDSDAKARVVKFFLTNSTKFYDVAEIAKRLSLPTGMVLAQLKLLKKGEFLKARSPKSFSINYSFPYVNELKTLAVKFPPVSDDQILREAKRLTQLKFLLIGGALIHSEKGRLEVLIVGDRIRDRAAESFVKVLEAHAARELRYALLTSQDFLYRAKMFDRFVLDVLEYPHRILINKLKFKHS